MFSGAVDRTQSRRPLVNIYRTNGEEIGKKLLQEGFARTWTRETTGASNGSWSQGQKIRQLD
ncbi:hypothetical protein NXC12_PD00029 (plasmid) [Rhizobium etli]|uniref:Uncharacterized protein n=1 Tax=Rhizobium etli TaxID=29449 RepID=A0AAN1BMJ9_RHIET|nr:hypothetical protein NXC12_PD00029 [Rhizobium etli]